MCISRGGPRKRKAPPLVSKATALSHSYARLSLSLPSSDGWLILSILPTVLRRFPTTSEQLPSMSYALQSAAAGASFFPTAKELSSGVQWFKDHPVLAAAAAATVSVITYWNAAELLVVAGSDEANDASACASEAPTAAPARPRKAQSCRSPLPPSLSRKSSGGAASDGKLSAAVSWCDEHGGSLTQVFEEETVSIDTIRHLSDGDSDYEADDVVEVRLEGLEQFQQRRRGKTSTLRKSGTTQNLEDAGSGGGPTEPESDPMQTESPQWGWYVPITPPQDQFLAGNGANVMVRGHPMLAPTHTQHGVAGSSAAEAAGPMRRSISGRMS
ncbi:hypothetical protein BBJ28_00013841 [Nothophytophthora sp. Chile5]|nr:hypothetical protein BBJ28_00013841 [Nothophytophthora sp. Chile5]